MCVVVVVVCSKRKRGRGRLVRTELVAYISFGLCCPVFYTIVVMHTHPSLGNSGAKQSVALKQPNKTQGMNVVSGGLLILLRLTKGHRDIARSFE